MTGRASAVIAAAYQMEMTASALMRGMVMTFMRWLLIRGILGQLTRRTFLCGLIARMHDIRRSRHRRNNKSYRHHHDEQPS